MLEHPQQHHDAPHSPPAETPAAPDERTEHVVQKLQARSAKLREKRHALRAPSAAKLEPLINEYASKHSLKWRQPKPAPHKDLLTLANEATKRGEKLRYDPEEKKASPPEDFARELAYLRAIDAEMKNPEFKDFQRKLAELNAEIKHTEELIKRIAPQKKDT
jgi:hypothetical protein